MHAEKLSAFCFLFFSDFGPRQLPFLPRVAGGLGSAFERHTRNLAAVRVDVLVMTGRRLLHRSVKRSYSEFLNTHLPHSPLMFHPFNATVAWCAPQRVTISTLVTPSPFIIGLLRIIHG